VPGGALTDYPAIQAATMHRSRERSGASWAGPTGPSATLTRTGSAWVGSRLAVLGLGVVVDQPLPAVWPQRGSVLWGLYPDGQPRIPPADATGSRALGPERLEPGTAAQLGLNRVSKVV